MFSNVQTRSALFDPELAITGKMCNWGKWEQTNELHLTRFHPSTDDFSVPTAYFIKNQSKG